MPKCCSARRINQHQSQECFLKYILLTVYQSAAVLQSLAYLELIVKRAVVGAGQYPFPCQNSRQARTYTF